MFNFSKPHFSIDSYMSEADIQKVRNFCAKINQGPVVYPIYPEIYGPIIDGQQCIVRLSFRWNHISFDVLKEYPSCGWGIIISQLLSTKFNATSIRYDYNEVNPEVFYKLHPYSQQLHFSNRVLSSLSDTDKSAITKIHKQKVNKINSVMREYKSSIKELLKNLL